MERQHALWQETVVRLLWQFLNQIHSSVYPLAKPNVETNYLDFKIAIFFLSTAESFYRIMLFSWLAIYAIFLYCSGFTILLFCYFLSGLLWCYFKRTVTRYPLRAKKASWPDFEAWTKSNISHGDWTTWKNQKTGRVSVREAFCTQSHTCGVGQTGSREIHWCTSPTTAS